MVSIAATANYSGTSWNNNHSSVTIAAAVAVGSTVIKMGVMVVIIALTLKKP